LHEPVQVLDQHRYVTTCISGLLHLQSRHQQHLHHLHCTQPLRLNIVSACQTGCVWSYLMLICTYQCKYDASREGVTHLVKPATLQCIQAPVCQRPRVSQAPAPLWLQGRAQQQHTCLESVSCCSANGPVLAAQATKEATAVAAAMTIAQADTSSCSC